MDEHELGFWAARSRRTAEFVARAERLHERGFAALVGRDNAIDGEPGRRDRPYAEFGRAACPARLGHA